MNLWTSLLVGVGAIQALGLFAFLVGLARAPKGFQDGTGFHLGTESVQSLPTHDFSATTTDEDTLPPFGRAA